MEIIATGLGDDLHDSAGAALQQGQEIKGPAIFLAQFAGDEPPFNSLDGIAQWASGLGFRGVQIPSWDKRLFDLDKAAGTKMTTDAIFSIASMTKPLVAVAALTPTAESARRGRLRPVTPA